MDKGKGLTVVNDDFRDGWDRTFGKKKCTPVVLADHKKKKKNKAVNILLERAKDLGW